MWRRNSSKTKAKNDLPRTIIRMSFHDQVRPICQIPLIPLERVYDGYEGRLFTLESHFHFHVRTDSSFHGEIRRKQENDANTVALCNGKKRKRLESTSEPDDIVIGHVIGNAQVVSVNEPVVSLSSSVNYDDTSVVKYYCSFEVLKRLHPIDRYSLTCSTPFPVAPDASAVDTWQFSSVCEQDRQVLRVSSSALTSDKQSRTGEAVESFEEQKLFQLQPVEWNQHQQEEEQAEKEALMIRTRQPSVLNPLRPGKYEFIGFTTSDTPSVIPVVVPRQTNGCRDRPRPVMTTTKNKCLVTLRLLPDGTLRGTSREVVQPQVCQLHGRWSAKRVVYTMEYRVREAVGHFRYSGAVVIDKGGAGVSNSKKMKCKSKANACGKRYEMLSGKWRNVDQDHADGYEGGRGEFKLELVRVDFTSIAIKTDQIEYGILPDFQQKQQQQINQDTGAAIDVDDNDDAIHAFTSGEYELSGCATDADGYEYAFDLEMQLHPGGKLLGWSKERIFQQTCPVFGRWEPSRIVYSQQYMVQHEVGMYTYSADMSTNDAVVRGTWANAEVDCASAPSEHGTFALILVKSTRRWSTFSHSYYPLKFRQRVLTILMASARRHEIPGVIWTNVFAFCNETWFT